MNKALAALNKEFPALKSRSGGRRLVYLDSACTVLKMRGAADAQRGNLLRLGGCGGRRSFYTLSAVMEEEFEAARRTVADFMGAGSPGEIIFAGGVTDAVNLLANSFPFTKDRNEVVLSPLEHNAVFLPFERLAAAGRVKLKVLPLKGLAPDLDALPRLLGRRTALVCLNHASNIFGGRQELRRAAAMTRAAGAYLFSDDAQFSPTHGSSAAAEGADACAFSGHKLGAPYCTGALYVRRELMSKLRPWRVGGGTVEGVVRDGGSQSSPHRQRAMPPCSGGYRVKYLGGNRGFEAGVQNYAGAAGLAAAIKRLERAGFGNIRAHVSGLVMDAHDRMSAIKGVRVLGDKAALAEGSLISIVPEKRGFSAQDFALFLDSSVKGLSIAVRSGRHCADLACLSSGVKETLRLSYFAYNTPADTELFARALGRYLKMI